MAREFRWLSAGPIPAACDLRAVGWSLCDDTAADDASRPGLLLAHGDHKEFWQLRHLAKPLRRHALVWGVDNSRHRVRLLQMGFAEVTGGEATLAEIDLRARRVVEAAATIPRRRPVGPLVLDLVDRDASVNGKALGLHPREFALLWRLAERPGEALGAEALLRDVWRLSFRPETNTLAVHVSRLRAKLRHLGLVGLLETTADGGYRLAIKPISAWLLAGYGVDLALDAHVRLGKEDAIWEKEPADAAGIAG